MSKREFPMDEPPDLPYCHTMKNDPHAQLAGLAEHLGNQRNAILKRWRAATEDAPGVSVASETSPGKGSTFRVILPSQYEAGGKQ